MKQKLNFETEYININGRNQFFLHFPSIDKDVPVILFVHGGPGMAESIFAHAFHSGISELYTVVYWDQRGAGKTLTKNKNDYPTMDELLRDFKKVVYYLKSKYQKDKIVILGHSFGSILSSLYVLKNPNDVLYYIGAGQVISIIDNEEVGYSQLKNKIIEANNKKDLEKLDGIGTYPEKKYDKAMIKKIQTVRILQGKYKIGMNFIPIMKTMFHSPIFKLSDLLSILKGMTNNVPLWEFMFSHSLEKETENYNVPVYYILGDSDSQAPTTIAKAYFAFVNAPRKELFEVKDAGHFMMLDQPKQFVKILEKIRYDSMNDCNIFKNVHTTQS